MGYQVGKEGKVKEKVFYTKTISRLLFGVPMGAKAFCVLTGSSKYLEW